MKINRQTMKIYEVMPEADELDINEPYVAFYITVYPSVNVEDRYTYYMYGILVTAVVGRV